LAALYRKIPVAHVEAGLRTHNIFSPWPEEANRQIATRLSVLHFAPTESARRNLIAEGVAGSTVHVTGNTVIDALHYVLRRLKADELLQQRMRSRFDFISDDRKLVLVTGHRRENFGNAFERICSAILEIAQDPEVQIVYPVHLNPNVQEPVRKYLGRKENIVLLEPLDYLPFVYLMGRSDLILTDSGGVQEEAPTIGKTVLLMRDATERPEAVGSGMVKLVGTDQARIVAEARRHLSGEQTIDSRTSVSPFGDGKASERIASVFKRMKSI
jgi:UDP-N-acetylglucosamine 2-epimerase (non-hydrolysing)